MDECQCVRNCVVKGASIGPCCFVCNYSGPGSEGSLGPLPADHQPVKTTHAKRAFDWARTLKYEYFT